MTPDLPAVLTLVAEGMLHDVLPVLPTHAYAAQSLQRSAVLLQTASAAYEHSAARRVDEWLQRAALFSRAAAVVDDAGLRARLAHLAAEPLPAEPDGWRFSVLDARLAERADALIALHEWCETSGHAQAAALEQAVWAELAAATQRRRQAIDRF
jgi:hypothetical protein